MAKNPTKPQKPKRRTIKVSKKPHNPQPKQKRQNSKTQTKKNPEKQRQHTSKCTQKAMDLDAVAKAKWKSEYDKDPTEFVKKSAALAAKPVQARLLRIENGAPIFYMVCVGCKEEKPALPTFFGINQGEAKLMRSSSGHELYNNCPSYPCRVCNARLLAVHHATADGWVETIMQKYTSLRASDTERYGNTPVGWFWERFRLQGGDFIETENGEHIITKPALCAITFIALEIGGIHLPYCACINNKDVATKGIENHRSEDCELICAELNVAQQHEDIKDLKECWRQINESVDMAEAAPEAAEKAKKEAIEAAKENWANRKNKSANGVPKWASDPTEYCKQCNNLDLYTICSSASSDHRKRDVTRNYAMDGKQGLTAVEIYEMYLAQPRCAISGVLLTILNGTFRFSVDRIDNSKGHFKGNCRLVCRMFNSRAGMTREKFLEMRAAWKAHC